MSGRRKGEPVTVEADPSPQPPHVAILSGAVPLECDDVEAFDLDVLLLDDGRRVIPERSCSRMIDGDADTPFDKIVLIPGLSMIIDAQGLAAITLSAAWDGEIVHAYPFDCVYRLMCAYADTSEDGRTPLLQRHRIRGRRCRSLLGLFDAVDITARIDGSVAASCVGVTECIEETGRRDARPKLLPDAFWDEIWRIGHRPRDKPGMPQWWGKLINWLIYDTLDPEMVRRINDLRSEHGTQWYLVVPDDLVLSIVRTRADEVTQIARSCDTFDDLRYRVSDRFGTGLLQRRLFEHAT